MKGDIGTRKGKQRYSTHYKIFCFCPSSEVACPSRRTKNGRFQTFNVCFLAVSVLVKLQWASSSENDSHSKMF